MFLGAALGMVLSHAGGLPMVDGVGMGIGAMTVVMMNGLPLTSVLLSVLFLQSDAAEVMPLVIVAVAVSFVVNAYVAPRPQAAAPPAVAPAAPAAPST